MSTAVSESKNNKENTSIMNKNMMKCSAGTDCERRTLKTLQLSANGTMMGSAKQTAKSKIIVSKKPLKIFQDKNAVNERLTCEVETQTLVSQVETEAQTEVTGATGVHNTQDVHNDSGAADLDQEAYDLMVRDPIPESYWRELAEERRLSLAEALSENEVLHQSMEELKEENNNLSLLAGQAEHLASVLNDVLCDEEDKESTGEDETEEAGENETTPEEEEKDVVKSCEQSITESKEETEKNQSSS